MPIVVKEPKVAVEAASRLEATLREAPFLSRATIRRESSDRAGMDLILTVRSGSMNRRLVCEVKSSGQPRIAREACRSLQEYVRSRNRDYPVFIAPYIAPTAAAICDQYQVRYLDFAGNCRLAFDQVYIRREGFPNPLVQRRGLRSLYSPKAERVLRVLLTGGQTKLADARAGGGGAGQSRSSRQREEAFVRSRVCNPPGSSPPWPLTFLKLSCATAGGDHAPGVASNLNSRMLAAGSR